ncbi:hypothetical protein GW17_00057676 [Ensete ventricosum]|nr:hypothetical protein GW17_00057676 [Ensete ventricosum]
MGSRMSTVSRKNVMVITLPKITRKVSFRSVFRAPSQNLKKLAIPNELARKVSFRSVFRAPSLNFKILAITNVLAHGKSYEHGHKLYVKSRAKSTFDRFLVHRLEISK